MRSFGVWSRACATTRSSCSTPDGTHRDLERRRRAHQGLRGRRGHRPALLDVLHARGAGHRLARRRAAARRRGRPLRGRGLARAQGRHALLGQRRHHAAARRRRRAARLLEGHARPDRAARARRAPAARARRSLRLLVDGVQDYAIFMLDPDGRDHQLERRRRAHQGLHRRRDHRPATSRCFYPPRGGRGAAGRSRSCERAATDGRFEDEGWRAAQGRHALLGQRGHHRHRRRRAARCSASPRSRAT